MPFRMTIADVQSAGEEIAISGRLTEGMYFGPEAVVVPLQDGTDFHAWVTTHSMAGKCAWPVKPSDDLVLTISVRRPPQGVAVDRSRPVVGHGSLLMNDRRLDFSEVLKEPVFWAMALSLHLVDEQGEEAALEDYFEVTEADVNAFYEERIHGLFHSGVWPFVRIDLDGRRFVEIEYAASVEHQVRIWLGLGQQRALVGYHSGHFSLPAFRFDEVLWFPTRTPKLPAFAALMLAACYVPAVDDGALEAAVGFCQQIPGLKDGGGARFAGGFLQSCVVPGIEWSRRADYGWVNNWSYSQRNPDGGRSTLEPRDYVLIDDFFGV